MENMHRLVVVVHLKMLKVCLFTILFVGQKGGRRKNATIFRCFFFVSHILLALVQLIVVLCIQIHMYVCIKKANVNIYATIRLLSLYLFSLFSVLFIHFRFLFRCHAEIFASIFDFFWSLRIFAQVLHFFFLFNIFFLFYFSVVATKSWTWKSCKNGKMCSTATLRQATFWIHTSQWMAIAGFYVMHILWAFLENFLKQMKIHFFVDTLGHHFSSHRNE